MSLEAAEERHKTLGRNDSCSCESGKKYKKCHQLEDDALILADLRRLAELAKAEVAAKLAVEEASENESDGEENGAKGSKTEKTTGKKKGGKNSQASSSKGGGRSGKGGNAQSLPRRGAV